ncbi:MAG: hypothetical protein WCA37_13480, partial [Terracidiphilus sp.]
STGARRKAPETLIRRKVDTSVSKAKIRAIKSLERRIGRGNQAGEAAGKSLRGWKRKEDMMEK